jgi:HEAT repeat protein
MSRLESGGLPAFAQACQALVASAQRDARTVAALMDCLQYPSGQVRRIALDTLDQVAGHAQLPLDVLRHLLHDEFTMVRALALEVTATRFGGTLELLPLLTALLDDPDVFVRTEAIRSLARLRSVAAPAVSAILAASRTSTACLATALCALPQILSGRPLGEAFRTLTEASQVNHPSTHGGNKQ